MTDGISEKRIARRRERADKLSSAMWRLGKRVKNAVFPPDITCDCCGDELRFDTRYNLCARCIEAMTVTGENICLICGTPINDEAEYCIRCENSEYKFLINRSPLVYDGTAKNLLYSLKFGGKKYIAATLGALMTDEYIKRGMRADIAVFVPMTCAEEKSRGFNQSELLAREVGSRLNMPVLPALEKIKDTAAQKKLTGKERAENLSDAFVCKFNQVKDRRILLVDDVFTTGATANACASALLKAGAREVSVLTAAVTEKKIPVESNDELKTD